MARDGEITTKAIDAIKNDSTKLNRFTITPRKETNPDDYISIIAYRAFTLAKLNEKHKLRFAKFIELSDKTTADFGYLCDILANTEEFKKYDFKLNPILELYEDLLRENWKVVKTERDLLNDIDAFDNTPECNVKICKAIKKFLNEYVLTQSKTASI